ncbi:hypothetical protein C8J43_102746 [Sphingomonas sp. PP-CE-1G-424]|nr:hypothetical protein C8J43_102746 [Sphingomonas sp. PP-CE-1G-424]
MTPFRKILPKRWRHDHWFCNQLAFTQRHSKVEATTASTLPTKPARPGHKYGTTGCGESAHYQIGAFKSSPASYLNVLIRLNAASQARVCARSPSSRAFLSCSAASLCRARRVGIRSLLSVEAIRASSNVSRMSASGRSLSGMAGVGSKRKGRFRTRQRRSLPLRGGAAFLAVLIDHPYWLPQPWTFGSCRIG